MRILPEFEHMLSCIRSDTIILSLPIGVTPPEFAAYATDVRNAPVIFSTPFYTIDRITTNGEIPKDSSLLRRKGSTFTCEGEMNIMSITGPFVADFEVVTFVPEQQVGVVSRGIWLDGKSIEAELAATWTFASVNGKTEAKLGFTCTLNGILAAIGKLVPQDFITEEMRELARKIGQDFKKKRQGEIV